MLEFQFNGYNLDLEKLEKGINIFIKNQKMTKKTQRYILTQMTKWHILLKKKEQKNVKKK